MGCWPIDTVVWNNIDKHSVARVMKRFLTVIDIITAVLGM